MKCVVCYMVDKQPLIFLGCPDTDIVLSVLPGHELLKQGKGCEAIALTAYGGLMAVFMILLIAFVYQGGSVDMRNTCSRSLT